MRERVFQIVQRVRPGDKMSHAYDLFIVAIAFLSIMPLMLRPHDAPIVASSLGTECGVHGAASRDFEALEQKSAQR